MPRPRRCRRICTEPDYIHFYPEGSSNRAEVTLTVDEYEVIRLIDLEKFSHEQCARQMDISRTTVTEIYETARQKLADSLVHGKPLRISGGHYRFCDGSAVCYCQKNCKKANGKILKQTIQTEGANHDMRIAVTFENGNVFPHFGHAQQFKLYDVEDGKVVGARVVDTNGSGHGALAGMLSDLHVDTLICGGIGAGAQAALAEAGIHLYGGVSGSADEAVNQLLTGNLVFDPDVHCSHHGEGHNHGEGHHCGEDRQGCAGSGCC